MDLPALAALFLASAINAGLPGPCVLTTMGRTAGSGWRAGAAVTLGVLTADILLVVAAAMLMMGAMQVSPAAVGIMKWAGVAALVGLAARCLWPAMSVNGRAERMSARDVAAGFAVGFSSPFNLVFYLALLPQVMPSARPGMSTVAGMCGAILAGAAAAQVGAILVALGCAGYGHGFGRWVDRACAASLLAFAAAAAMVPAGRAGFEPGPAELSAR